MTDDRTPGSAHGAEKALDAALSAWGRHEAGDAAAVARIVSSAGAFADANAVENQTSARSRPRWLPLLMGGGAIAASIAVAIALLPAGRPGASVPREEAIREVQLASADDPAMDSFAMLYTVSDEEEYYL